MQYRRSAASAMMGAVTDHPPTIAILDDEVQMRRALRRLLGSHGLGVELFEDGPALVAAQATHRFDCILLDLQMPGMNGIEVLERLAGSAPHPPVVVITGCDQPGIRQRTTELGASGYLLKPLDETTLLGAIRQCIARTVLNQGSMAGPPPLAEASPQLQSSSSIQTSTKP